jgi:aspartokinase/homoserine dehydrogenase 1
MIVLKFGGTSVGNVIAIKNLVSIVKHKWISEQQPIVVCSALDGVTNQLQQAGSIARTGMDYLSLLNEMENLHYSLVRELLPISQQNPVLMSLKAMFNEVEELLLSVSTLQEYSDRSNDRILAYGELFSMELITACLRAEEIKAVATDARKFIRTDNNFGCATVRKTETEQNIASWQKELNDIVPVITGFIAANEKGETTTLGRGGSDLTAALFAAALKVREIQIWTDVDGFLTADPRLVKNAFSMYEISYREAMELSYFGAKVIYSPTLIPAIQSQIPIRIKNTFNPSHPGTLVHGETQSNDHLIRGISSIEFCCLVNIEGNGIVGMKGFCGRLFGVMARAGVNVIFITQASSEQSISFAIQPDDEKLAQEAILNEFASELADGKIATPQMANHYSIIAVVGENMRHNTGLCGKIFSTLGKSGINLVAIAQGSSELNISIMIERKQLSHALNVLHDSLLLLPIKTLNLLCVGTGNIGRELLSQINKAEDNLSNQRFQINVIGICNSRKMILSTDGEGFDLSHWTEKLENEGRSTHLDTFIHEASLLNLPNLIFVDNTACDDVARRYEYLFVHHISVVTCNKLANSGSYIKYLQNKQLSQNSGVYFHYETNVGAGLPIIKTLNDFHLSGDYLEKLEAVLSGTLSYVFNEYKGNKTFVEVIRKAQELGFTEPDPRLDLNGMDFARKLLILAREVGQPFELDQVKVKSFLPVSCLEAPTVEAFYEELELNEPHFAAFKTHAANEGKKLCFIGKIENGTIDLALKLVDNNHPFYLLTGSDNIVAFTTSRYQKNPMVIKGPGAGAEVTAAGVFADILRSYS